MKKYLVKRASKIKEMDKSETESSSSTGMETCSPIFKVDPIPKPTQSNVYK